MTATKQLRTEHNTSKSMLEKRLLRGSMLIGIISFVSAVAIGVWQIALLRGFNFPPMPETLPPHGNLMVGAFLGTLIIFERMSALPIKWLVWIPYTWGISAILIHLGLPLFKILNIVSLLGWGVHRFIAYRTFKHLWNPLIEFLSYIALSVALFTKGGLAGSVQSALTGFSFAIAVIGVERIELMLSFKRMSARIVYIGLIIYLLVSVVNSLFYLIPLRSVGLILLLISGGMLYNDSVAIASLKGSHFRTMPMHKFSREALMIAYLWLIFSSLSLILWDQIKPPIAKDIVFHSIGLGFVFTMILAHAPVVIASTLAKIPKHPPSRVLFYLFQMMTAVRIIGDLLFNKFFELWTWSGPTTGILHFIFFILYVLSVLRSFRS